MTRTQRTLYFAPPDANPWDPHDTNRETDIVEANTTQPWLPGGLRTDTRSVRTIRDMSGRPSTSLESQHCAIMMTSQSNDWDAEKLHADATVQGRQPAQAGT